MAKRFTHKDCSRRLGLEILEERNPPSDMRSTAIALPQTTPPPPF